MQSAELVRAAKDLLRQLTETSKWAQEFKDKVSSSKLQMSKIEKTRDDAISLANKQSKMSGMFGDRFDLLKDKLNLSKQK